MRMLTFAGRCSKEILRDPINLCFGLGFPLALLLLLNAIQSGIPVALFALPDLTPGVTVFGLSFLALFSATLVARDRESAFLQRLYTTPLTASDFILGYMLPLLPMALGQTLVCYGVSLLLGLNFSIGILYAALGILPVAIFYISLGLLCGSLLDAKQVGGICGALLTNLSAWLSGVSFDLKQIGGVFQKIAELLPFLHAAEMEKALLAGDFSRAASHFLPVILYTAVTAAAAIFCFLRQSRRQ